VYTHLNKTSINNAFHNVVHIEEFDMWRDFKSLTWVKL